MIMPEDRRYGAVVTDDSPRVYMLMVRKSSRIGPPHEDTSGHWLASELLPDTGHENILFLDSKVWQLVEE